MGDITIITNPWEYPVNGVLTPAKSQTDIDRQIVDVLAQNPELLNGNDYLDGLANVKTQLRDLLKMRQGTI